VKLLLDVASANAQPSNLSTDHSLSFITTILHILRGILKDSASLTPQLVVDFRENNGFELLEQLLVVVSSLGDENHTSIKVSSWDDFKEFGLGECPTLLDVKLLLIDMINELVFVYDGEKIISNENNDNICNNDASITTMTQLTVIITKTMMLTMILITTVMLQHI